MINKVDGFTYTTAIKKLRKLKKRIRVIPGGTSAGKTYGIIPLLADKAAKTANLEISIVSESIPHLKKGALKDFKKIMRVTGRWRPEAWHGTDLKYTFANNSYIEFFSADQEGKVRGPRRNELYINECNNLTFETYHQLAIRTDGNIWLDYNPTHEFWVHTELYNDEDVESLVLTYKDNEGLSDSIIKEIEKALTKGFFNPLSPDLFNEPNIKNKYWANWWKVYGLGLIGSLDGVIFSNWTQIHQIPPEAEIISRGMDFGYTNDPTTIVDIYKYDGKLILDERLYRTGMVNSDISNFDKLEPNRLTYIIADSAEPKSIEEISRGGMRIKGAAKGRDSIMHGIQTLQQYEILVTSRSTNLIKELRNYTWDVDREGNKLNKPIDAYNHLLDATRYGCEILSKPAFTLFMPM
jgi:phage terminase large subunit